VTLQNFKRYINASYAVHKFLDLHTQLTKPCVFCNSKRVSADSHQSSERLVLQPCSIRLRDSVSEASYHYFTMWKGGGECLGC